MVLVKVYSLYTLGISILADSRQLSINGIKSSIHGDSSDINIIIKCYC